MNEELTVKPDSQWTAAPIVPFDPDVEEDEAGDD